MRMHETMPGLSMTVAIGKWSRPHMGMADYSARICLGFIAITFYTLDIEEFIIWLTKRPREDSKDA